MELIIINRGRQSEEDIRVEFDPSYFYKMIASTSAGVLLEKNLLQIQRIPPKDEVSIILETTHKDFSKKNVAAISSKTTKGKLWEKLEEVPPNAGSAALVIGAFILIPVVMWLSIDAYDKYKEQKKVQSVKKVSVQGWQNLESYAESELAGLYSNGQFPVEINGYKRLKDTIILDIELINKADDWLIFGVKVVSPAGDKNLDLIDKIWIHDVMVAPKETSKHSFSAYLPAKFSHQFLLVEVNIKYKSKFFYGLQRQVNVSQQKQQDT
ncbi:MAG: hypothetical protein HZA11_12115 [Nitrospirae bacterium]|nr:hypothetical protein [Nitrospirota bacterium]